MVGGRDVDEPNYGCVCVSLVSYGSTLYSLIYHLISYVNITTASLLIYVATEIIVTSSRTAWMIIK